MSAENMIDPVEAGGDGAAPVEEAATNPQAAGKSPDRTIKATYTSIEQFRAEEPELFEGMMEGLALSIISKMRKHNDRIKQLMREGRRQK